MEGVRFISVQLISLVNLWIILKGGERERVFVCVCVCVRERERERFAGTRKDRYALVCEGKNGQ